MISGHCRQSDRAKDSATVHCDVRLLMCTRAERVSALSTLSRPQASGSCCKTCRLTVEDGEGEGAKLLGQGSLQPGGALRRLLVRSQIESSQLRLPRLSVTAGENPFGALLVSVVTEQRDCEAPR